MSNLSRNVAKITSLLLVALLDHGCTTTRSRYVAMTISKLGEFRQPLTSVAGNLRVEKWQVDHRDFEYQNGPWSIRKRTLHGGMQEGVDLIEVDNGRLRFTVIPTRGMSVGRVDCGAIRLGWDSPVRQTVHPKHIDLQDHGGLGWLGGFNEWLVRCGVSFAGHPGDDDGRLLTLHGRIGNIPAAEVEVVVDASPPHRIRIRGLVEERMFKFAAFDLWTEISTVPGSNTFRIEDRLVNKSSYAREYQMIYHANFGSPLLEAGAQFVAPVQRVYPFDDYAAKDLSSWTSYLGPTRDYGEQVYCVEPFADENGGTTVMLHNAQGNRGVALHYEVAGLPYFTLWKNTDTAADGYVTGLEPGTGYPYNRAVERRSGRVRTLAAGAEQLFRLEYEILSDQGAVQASRQGIEKIRAGRSAVVVTTPPKKD
jgi:hypothetical protein